LTALCLLFLNKTNTTLQFSTRVLETVLFRPVRNMRAVNIRQTLADQFLEVLEVVVAENTALLPEGEASHTHNTTSRSARVRRCRLFPHFKLQRCMHFPHLISHGTWHAIICVWLSQNTTLIALRGNEASPPRLATNLTRLFNFAKPFLAAAAGCVRRPRSLRGLPWHRRLRQDWRPLHVSASDTTSLSCDGPHSSF
jgi:hypothetical protein